MEGLWAIDGKSLWRFPHISAIFVEVNATVKSIGKVQLEHYDNAMSCITHNTTKIFLKNIGGPEKGR
jgi:hypothetical protein